MEPILGGLLAWDIFETPYNFVKPVNLLPRLIKLLKEVLIVGIFVCFFSDLGLQSLEMVAHVVYLCHF